MFSPRSSALESPKPDHARPSRPSRPFVDEASRPPSRPQQLRLPSSFCSFLGFLSLSLYFYLSHPPSHAPSCGNRTQSTSSAAGFFCRCAILRTSAVPFDRHTLAFVIGENSLPGTYDCVPRISEAGHKTIARENVRCALACSAYRAVPRPARMSRVTDRQKPDDEDAAALKLGPREFCRTVDGSHLTLHQHSP